MPQYDTWKKERDIEWLRGLAEAKLLHVDRPLLIHEGRTELGDRCDCGCDSKRAFVAERREHLQVLIDPLTGVRRVRSQVQDVEQFDDLASRAKRIWLPRRVSRKQLVAMECRASVFGLFGGVRLGKTDFGGQEICDSWCRDGGDGAQIWWVSPTQPKTQIGLNKLALGELTGTGAERRWQEPVFPRELLRYIPPSPRSDRCYLELLDGTRIWFKFASLDGGNLKGEAPMLVVLDEGAEVDKVDNFKQLLDRLMQSRGRLLIPTTPRAGHWLKSLVYDVGQPAEDWDGKHHTAWIHGSGYDNPWVDPKAVDEHVEKLGSDKQTIDREVHGKWVGSGPKLWDHFDDARHIIHHDGQTVEEWGLVNATRYAMGRFFRNPALKRYGGMDFNINPMSFVEIQIAVPKGLDPSHPANWIFCAVNELVERCPTIHAFADRLTALGYYGTPIACDPAGAQFTSYGRSHGVGISSTHDKELARAGYPTHACHLSANGEPHHPPQLDRINVFHKLMRETVTDPDGKEWPRYLISSRCTKTIDSHRIQESDEHGAAKKESGTESDRISGPIDAETYGGWPPFQAEYFRQIQVNF